MHDGAAGGWFASRAEAIDAGEPVTVWAYEVDLVPPLDLVRIEPDGSVAPAEVGCPR